jgi:hypothetical protein
MKSFDVGRFALSVSAATAFLAGCGGSQPPIGAAGATPQSRTIGTHAQRGGSWMQPKSKNGDLLYVADSTGFVYAFTYPKGEQVGQLGADATGGLCSDKDGNVFATDFTHERVVEYAHGGTSPIATLYPDAQPWDCGVDPATGDLATVNLDASDTSSVSIFKNASGAPSKYFDSDAGLGPTCSYDDAGNLYVSAANSSQRFLVAELPYGSSMFRNITVNGDFRGGNFLQWDGAYVAVANAAPKKAVTVSQVQISGSTGSVFGTTKLNGSYAYLKYFSIANGTIFTPLNGGGPKARKIGAWHYSDGGQRFITVQVPKGKSAPGIALGVTLSVAPSR